MKLQKVLNHKYFLYAAYVLMVVNLLGYISVSSVECIVVFALATYLCKYCLSKNKGLCIFVGLFASNILFGCGRVKEGYVKEMKAITIKWCIYGIYIS